MEIKDENKKIETRTLVTKAVKIALFSGLGYMAAGPLGALIGLILAMAK